MDKTQLNWTPEQIEDIRFVGYSYIRQGAYKIALTFFEALVALDPRNTYDVQTLGALYLQLNDLEKALKTLNQALALQPNHAPTLLNQAKVLIGLGYKDQALKIAKQLEKNKDSQIADAAGALVLAYR
ncbi:MAG: hypothetical protein K0S74_1177 [Chlamydiales bacterium]|jgi:tetratricopeptide (TPR) repeat protein|nr:hypothetical protein [Chlamydiales bacterium]